MILSNLGITIDTLEFVKASDEEKMALITKTPQQSLIDDFYKLEVISHLAHVNTRSYSAHLAFGDFYDNAPFTVEEPCCPS